MMKFFKGKKKEDCLKILKMDTTKEKKCYAMNIPLWIPWKLEKFPLSLYHNMQQKAQQLLCAPVRNTHNSYK